MYEGWGGGGWRVSTHTLQAEEFSDSFSKPRQKAQEASSTEQRVPTWPVFISDRAPTIEASVRWSRAPGLYWPAVDWLCRPRLTCSPCTRTHARTSWQPAERPVSVREQYPALCSLQLSTLINHHGDRDTALTVRTPWHAHKQPNTHTLKTSSCATTWKGCFWKVTMWHLTWASKEKYSTY